MTEFTPNSILKTEKLSIGYRNRNSETYIAQDININISPGQLVAVIGINGIGKSTLLRSLSGVQENLSGNILIDEKDLKSLPPLEQASLISLVLTGQPVSKNLSVFELVALGRQPYTNWIGRLTKNDLRHIKKSLRLVDIESLENKKCYELSDGQMQKVLIARALAQDTPLVILDEPTTHLDLYHKAYILQLLKKLTRKTNKAIIFASHEINLALQLCDKILLMQKNEIVMGSPQELIRSGKLSSIFPSDLIFFDKNSSSFKIKS
ncbi:ABC transporter ATP-binding protein [Salegentibacter sediminis]|uniref:ABC transporter ATP-binding protein n=1 Tax=Salegentibacter sediminis TaxID=1930251 RepID=UPI0009BCE04F|nr:ABC transporter ATP-binding protein [Salegentibacter sediminis]